MEYTFFKRGELKDREIISALQQAAKDYENGEIAEVKDMLIDIINSISEFERTEELLWG